MKKVVFLSLLCVLSGGELYAAATSDVADVDIHCRVACQRDVIEVRHVVLRRIVARDREAG